MKTVFNSNLLKRIAGILNTNFSEMARNLSSCSRDTVRRGLIRGDIRFDIFVEMANIYYLNIDSFFIQGEDDGKPASNIVMKKKAYRYIEYDPTLLQGYENIPEKITCNEVAYWMSVSGCPIPIRYKDGSLYAAKEEKHEDVEVKKEDVVTTAEAGNDTTHQPYIFNMQFFLSLPSSIGVSRSDIGLSIGRQSNMYTIATQHRNIRILSLVRICNQYHLDILQFFSFKEFVPMSVIVPDDKWKPVTFHPERLMSFATDRNQHILLEKINYSKQRLYRNINPESSPMNATNLCDICNILHISPSYFFDAPEVVSDQRIAMQLNKKIESQQELIERLNIEKRRLESQLRHAKAMRDI